MSCVNPKGIQIIREMDNKITNSLSKEIQINQTLINEIQIMKSVV